MTLPRKELDLMFPMDDDDDKVVALVQEAEEVEAATGDEDP